MMHSSVWSIADFPRQRRRPRHVNHVFRLQTIRKDERVRRIDHRNAGVLEDVAVIVRRQWFCCKTPYAQIVLLHDDLLLALELNKYFKRSGCEGTKRDAAVRTNFGRYKRPGNRRHIGMIPTCNGREPAA